MNSNLSSIAVKVCHMEKMAAFYTAAFGIAFREVDVGPFKCRFGALDGVTFKLVPLREKADFDDFPNHQLGFQVADVEAVIAAAVKHGGRQEGELTRDGEHLHGAVRDPDGNSIELYG